MLWCGCFGYYAVNWWNDQKVEEISYTQFIKDVNNGKITEITTQGQDITGEYNLVADEDAKQESEKTADKEAVSEDAENKIQPTHFETRMPVNENLLDRLPDMNNDGVPDIPDQDGDGAISYEEFQKAVDGSDFHSKLSLDML